MMPRLLLDVARDRAGAAFLEFTIAMPVLVLVLMGVLQFGLFFYDSIMVTNAAAVGTRQFSISRLSSAPYSGTVSLINAALPSNFVGNNNFEIALAVNGTSCSIDSTCYGLLNPNPPTLSCAGRCTASATLSYPCPTLMPASWVSFGNVCPNGLITVGFTQLVQ